MNHDQKIQVLAEYLNRQSDALMAGTLDRAAYDACCSKTAEKCAAELIPLADLAERAVKLQTTPKKQ